MLTNVAVVFHIVISHRGFERANGHLILPDSFDSLCAGSHRPRPPTTWHGTIGQPTSSSVAKLLVEA
jgi:hypothetical protein